MQKSAGRAPVPPVVHEIAVLILNGAYVGFLLHLFLSGRTLPALQGCGAPSGLGHVILIASTMNFVRPARRNMHAPRWAEVLFGMWALLLVLGAVLTAWLSPFQSELLRALAFVLFLMPCLPLRPSNLRSTAYRIHLVLRGYPQVFWYLWVAYLLTKQWRLTEVGDFLELVLAVVILTVLLALVYDADYGPDWVGMRERERGVRLATLFAKVVPYVSVAVLAYSDYLLVRALVVGDASPALSSLSGYCAVTFMAAGALYVIILYAFVEETGLGSLTQYRTSGLLLALGALLTAAFIALLPALFRGVALWEVLVIVLIASLPVLPLRPANWRSPGYRAGFLWRTLSVPFWGVGHAYIFALGRSFLVIYLGIVIALAGMIYLWERMFQSESVPRDAKDSSV